MKYGDLISRQAAIDAMCELMHHWFGCDSKDEIREIKQELGKLPSAQEKQRGLVGWRCPVCGRGLSPFESVCPCNNGKGWEITC